MAFKMKSPYPKTESVKDKFLRSKKKSGPSEKTNPKYWEGKKSPHENL